MLLKSKTYIHRIFKKVKTETIKEYVHMYQKYIVKTMYCNRLTYKKLVLHMYMTFVDYSKLIFYLKKYLLKYYFDNTFCEIHVFSDIIIH